VARELARDQIVLVNLSGRGDKDINSVREQLES
jgi:tryptophan synthase beta subunit